jgi:hypothetical protein
MAAAGDAAAPPVTESIATVPTTPPDPESAGSCPATDDRAIGLLVSPAHPIVGGSVRILASAFSPDPLAVRLQDESKKGADPQPVDVGAELRTGHPVATAISWKPERAGTYRVVVGRSGKGLRCATITVASRPTRRDPRQTAADGLWPVSRSWNEGEESLYSAWIREIFRAPLGQELAFGKLDEVTSDAVRNPLFDYFGWDEDSPKPIGLRLKPDCADTPYFFRAYYSWKRGLPFGFRSCSGGRPGVAPTCGALQAIAPRVAGDEEQAAKASDGARLAKVDSTHDAIGAAADAADRPDLAALLERPRHGKLKDDGKRGELAAVQDFFSRTLAWGVHTGNGRTAFGDDASDFYPVSLTPHGLRPGTIYADPYGHVLMLVESFPASGGRPGVLYAIDGQPDGSITRKRFWEGNFLFNSDPALGGSGFKAFRPLMMRDRAGNAGGDRRLVSLRDEEIAKEPGYGDSSREQSRLSADQFYDRVERLITPGVRDPLVAQEEEVRALAEAARVRVTSVDNGQKYFVEHPTGVIDMPSGDGIFEASGPWEDYSTPARDLRLLIAMQVVTHFEDKIARSPDAYGVSQGPALDALRAKLIADRERLLKSVDLGFSYTRSDGSKWSLSLADLVARKTALEVAYNPNDCPEVRWGAPPGSDEVAPCKRRTPDDQQRKLEAYRVWFRERRRPPRGDPGPPVP